MRANYIHNSTFSNSIHCGLIKVGLTEDVR
jgi:hypothetical protein